MLRLREVQFAWLGVSMLPALVACTATVQSEPAYVEVADVPADIEVYPHTYYEGHTVYLVNNDWYYRDGSRWVYYRAEPAPLYRQRTYIQRAPPARRSYPASRRERTSREVAAPPERRVERARPDDDNEARKERKWEER